MSGFHPNRRYTGWRKAIDRIVDLFGLLSIVLLCMLTVLMVYDVAMRFVFHQPTDWVLDLVQLTQVALAFVAAAPVLRAGGHINMELLSTSTSGRTRQVLEGCANLICTLGCVWLVALTWRTFIRSYQISEASYGVGIPVYPWKLLLPISFLVLALQFFGRSLDAWKGPEVGLEGEVEDDKQDLIEHY